MLKTNKSRKQLPLEPIAIIGIGCRFPGSSNDWQSYWDMLISGRDAITETPSERWNLQKFYSPEVAKPGKTQSKWGGYVTGLDQFDPQLFGISPREASNMDPQQRMLLEVAYRAVEDAGQPTEKVAGEAVSVFVGISSFDYAISGLSYQDRGVINTYSNTGASTSIAANRISYCFDLRGPSVAVDTACSSSLVAVHMACESIWRGDAKMALAGGVNALIMPDFYIAFSQLGVLSPDGRCKTFDARANGYVRSEGAGMVMLKPLSEAIRDNDPVYSVIRATALNQDGRTPGMTVPSQAAQEQLMRSACRKANVRPSDIQYVEAHGTGTPVGDPIEAAALGSILGEDRGDEPCLVGSVKTNIGHLEAGAGIASLIKVALSLHHRKIPANLHFQKANPSIDFEHLNLRVPTEPYEWTSDTPRLAGINGFGYGGANAHVIMEEAPAAAQSAMQGVGSAQNGKSQHHFMSGSRTSGLTPPVLLPFSARSRGALTSVASSIADWLEENPHYELPEVAGYLAHRRSHQDYRVALSAHSNEAMIAELRSIAASSPEEFAEEFSSAKLAKGPVFVCSGQGPQWWAMGRGLLKYSPAFRSVIKECDAEFSKYGDWSLLEELTRSENESRMQKTSIAQPSIFAIQVALAAVWKSWGVKPTAIVGHSVGEIAAAYLSGALSWQDACRVAFHRGRTMDLATSHGAMVAAGLSPEEVPKWITGIESEVSIAAINGPSSVTISGDADAVEVLAQRLEEAGVFCRRLAVEYAFHSPQMEPVREELLDSLKDIQPRRTHTPMISTVSGQPAVGDELDAQYWWKNVRQAVRFSEAMTYLAGEGFGVAVEIGPHPVLAYAINECFQESGKSVRSVPSLNRQQDDLQCMSKSLGSLFALGFDIAWSGFYNKPQRKIPVPTYPFQWQRCWGESRESSDSRHAHVDHPLLGERIDAPSPAWESRIDLRLQDYLKDHLVRGTCVFPAAGVIDSAFAASRAIHDSEVIKLERLQLHNPCMMDEDRALWFQSSYDSDRRRMTISARDANGGDWSPIASVSISTDQTDDSHPEGTDFASQLDTIRSRCTLPFDQKLVYEYLGAGGLHYGPTFQGIKGGLRSRGECIADVSLADQLRQEARDDYLFHPALLDSCFHSMIAADKNFDHTIDGLFLPAEIESLSLYKKPTERLTVHTRVLVKSERQLVCDLDIYDDEGQLCLAIRGFKSVRVHGGSKIETTEDLLYSYDWKELPLETEDAIEPGSPAHWLVFMDEGNIGRELVERLKSRQDRVTEIYHDSSRVAQTNSAFYQIDATRLESFREVLGTVLDDTQTPVDHVVYLWGLDVPANHELGPENLEKSTELTSLAPMHLVQAWDQLPVAPSAELSIISCGAQSQDGEPEATRVAQGPLVGFGRVIVSEYAKFRTKLIDLPVDTSTHDLDNLVDELLAKDDEDEILWRKGKRFAHRFTPQAGKPASTEAAESMASQLRNGKSAGIDELHYETKPNLELSSGEVEIEVFATGLNFSDVMKSLDMYPGLPDGPVDLGAECSGRISRTGPDSDWKVGDEVIAVAPGAFGTHVSVNQVMVARKPSNLSHEQAAALPIAFLTAHYALNECARIRRDDKILIHSASGGVGMAAMQFAKLAGAKIFATAGTDEKRKLVSDLGAAMVMDSRSLAFSDQVLEATDGEGVDAVLNSLPGEAIPKGLATLKTGGRFLEIGKRDIYGDSSLGLYPFRNNLSLFAIDLDQLFKQQPARMGEMLRQLVPRFEKGELQPLPVTTYGVNETRAAFRFMQQGKHIGKVVVGYDERPAEVQNGDYAPVAFESDASYWIAGGLGGFGLEVTKWMVACGARSLVLSGRSKTLRPEAEKVVAELASQGVQITILPADITDLDQVHNVVAQIQRELPPLRGVIHTAMVLEDKLLVDLDRPTLERVLRPKVLGGWNLHQATQDCDLDMFVVFSSLSSVFGHAGQANYSAANALLDSLAYYRRAQGLPATVMNWGHLGEVGYLAEREQLGQRLERQGVLSFTVEQAMNCLEYALQTQSLQLSVLRMDWSVWRGLGITNRVSPKFAHLLCHASESADASQDVVTASTLRAAAIPKRLEMVDRMLRNKAGTLLGIAPDQIQSDRALLEMGLDSLMAVELRNWIENKLEINLPIAALMRSESLEQVVEAICDIIAESGETPIEPPSEQLTDSKEISDSQAEELLEQLPDLGNDEVTQLLSQMLKEQG